MEETRRGLPASEQPPQANPTTMGSATQEPVAAALRDTTYDEALVERLARAQVEHIYDKLEPRFKDLCRETVRKILAELSKTHAVLLLAHAEALCAIVDAAVCCRETITKVTETGWADDAIVANLEANEAFHRALSVWMNMAKGAKV